MSAGWLVEYRTDGIARLRRLVEDAEVESLARATTVALEGTSSVHAIRNLFDRVPETRKLASDLSNIAGAALGSEAFVIRGLYFDKTAESNWLVPWHQDLAIAVRERRYVYGFGPWSVKEGVIHVQPPEPWLSRRVAIRVHLDDCGAENGALRVVAGTHRRGLQTTEEIERVRPNTAESVATAERGDGLVMSPMLLHASSRAISPHRRRVIHIEYAADPLPAGLEWYESGR